MSEADWLDLVEQKRYKIAVHASFFNLELVKDICAVGYYICKY